MAEPAEGERLAAQVEVLQAQVANLSYQLERLSALLLGLVNDDAPAGLAGWELEVGPAGAAEAVRWVHWLIAAHGLEDIPECWAEHSGLVEELMALRAGWESRSDGRGAGMGELAWHEALTRAVERVKAGRWRACVGGPHQPDRLPAWVARQAAEMDQSDRYSP